MNSLKKRADKIFDRVGEEFLINGTTAAKGIIMLLDKNRMHVFFDDIEQDQFDRPALIVLAPADTPVALNNTVTRDGRTYTVTRLSKRRYRNEVVTQYILLT